MPTLEHKKLMLKHMQAETRKAGDVFLLWSTAPGGARASPAMCAT
jgi:hypothetical protein